MKKIYINITNSCDMRCPFCCMSSSPDKNSYMKFDVFKKIVDDNKEGTIFQLEGGEPLLHKDLLLFIEYIGSLGGNTSIVIDTNSTLLYKIIDKIIEISERRKVLITIKPS